MRSERIDFTGHSGDKLAARLDLPDREPTAAVLFAHCFTCSKDIAAARRIAQRLASLGLAVLRFDFTGLGHSQGEFANTHFSSNVEDLIRAAAYLDDRGLPPRILIGHSLGGAAVLAAAGRIASAKAVVTIGAPADPGHVTHLFSGSLAEIDAKGEAEVALGGRPFTIKRAFLEDVAASKLEDCIRNLDRALLVLHAPLDEIVGIENAATIFMAAKHPKSFVTLDDADHLLTPATPMLTTPPRSSPPGPGAISKHPKPTPSLPAKALPKASSVPAKPTRRAFSRTSPPVRSTCSKPTSQRPTAAPTKAPPRTSSSRPASPPARA